MTPTASLGDLLAEVLGEDFPLGLRTWEGVVLKPEGAPATVVVRSPEALVRVLQRPGQLGLARAYVAGDLDVEGDLVEALHRASHLDGFSPTATQWAALARHAGVALLVPRRPPPEEVRLHGRRHSVGRDRRAVTHHYDLPGEFYRLLLGPAMTYSCAVFEEADAALEDAQRAKHDLVARKLDLRAGERFLDVGCGWGGMVEHAVTGYGVRAVGVTLSAPQQAWAARRLERTAAVAGGGTAEIRVQDYRLVEDGPYDAVSSIGMSEHVGEAALPRYFAQLFSLLRPGGRLLNHAISSIPAQRVPGRWLTSAARPRLPARPAFGEDTFIARYVFPDGELVEVGRVVSAMQEAGFEVRHVESLREHYPLTLRRWLANLDATWPEAVALVGDGRARAWRLYLAGSIHSFEVGRIAVHQVLAVRPEAGRSGMPLRPAY